MEVVRSYDFYRDLVAIRVTDGVMVTLTPFTGEIIDAYGQEFVTGIALEQFESRWQRIIAERSPRMRAAYDRRRRARRARARA
jgi:hypothetical protein